MSGRGSQRKGRTGELELTEALRRSGYDVKPGRSQSYGEEPDIIGLPGVHIECKRCERLQISEWIKQAIRDSERFKDGKPIVFHRRNNEEWLITMRLTDFMDYYNRVQKMGQD